MILYVENPEDSQKNWRQLIDEFSKVQDITSTYQKNQFHFYTQAMNNPKRKR